MIVFICTRRKRNLKSPQNNQLIYSLDTENNNSTILSMHNEDLSIASIPSYKPSYKSNDVDSKKKEDELPTYDNFVKKSPKY